MNEIKRRRLLLREESKKFGPDLVELPCHFHSPVAPIRAWRNRDFLVQLFIDRKSGMQRLAVNRSDIDSAGNWKDGITWDELQRLKSHAGFGHIQAIEFYPPDAEIVYDHNIRHLWLMIDNPLPFAWTRENAATPADCPRVPDTAVIPAF